MRHHLQFLLFIFLGITLTREVNAQATFQAETPSLQIKRLARELDQRLQQLQGSAYQPLPPVVYDAALPANGRYEDGIIWIGPVQADFPTEGDKISLIYHEYMHARMVAENRFPVGMDAEGNILQWNTGETYLYQPSSRQVSWELRAVKQRFGELYGHLSPAEREQHLQQVRTDLSRPQEVVFVYAPSNLAREEIAAYRAQLEGERLGLYQLSEVARTSIQLRLEQLNTTYRLRREYEQKHGLSPAGIRLASPPATGR